MSQQPHIGSSTKSPGLTAASPLPFVKMHGLGNDFVVLDLRPYGDSDRPRIGPNGVRAIADRRLGVGCDQLIAIEPPRSVGADIFMRITNADGGEVAACGNATRCVAQLLFDELGRDQIIVETEAGLLAARSTGQNMVCVDMGPAKIDWQDLPLDREADTLDLPLSAGPLAHGVGVNMGNPHAVFFVDRVEDVDLAAWGPKLEHDRLFPERANISVAQIIGPDTIRSRTWERGVGITQACGSGACAVAVSAARRELTSRAVTVRLDGGDLHITWRDDGHVEMTGPVATSFSGTIGRDLDLDRVG